MKPITCILFGRAGSGKGTQSELLVKHLAEVDPERKTIYVETGQRFRDFIAKDKSYTGLRVKEVLANGELLPAFLPIWMWSGIFVGETIGNEHIVLDGLSRRPDESPIIDSAMRFYKREKPFVIYLNITAEEGRQRLLRRARHDDHDEKIKERMAWFESDVIPAMQYFKEHSFYNFVTINGDRPIPKVHEDIMKEIGL